MWDSGKKSDDPKLENADGGGIFSNFGKTDDAPNAPHPGAAKEGMFSKFGSKDKPQDATSPDAKNEGLFSSWGKKDESKKDGLFSDWGNKDKTQDAAEKDGMFSNWGKEEKPDAEKDGMFSNWGKKDEPGADKDGMFSNWGKKDEPDAEKDGMFSNWGNKDEAKKEEGGMFSDWGNKDKPKDEKKGMFSDWGKKEDAAEKDGLLPNWGKKDEPEKGGLFSNWGKKDDAKDKDSKFTDRFPGMQDEPTVENKAQEAPASNKTWFGGKDKPPADSEKKPGLFDKMLGRDRDKLAEQEQSQKPGIFDKLRRKDKDKSAVAEKNKPGMFSRMMRKDKKASPEKGGSNKLPGFLSPGTSRDDEGDSSHKKLTPVRSPGVSTRTVVKIPLLILLLVVMYLSYQYQKAKENSLGSGMSGGTVAEYSEYAFPSQSDWCGHPVNKPRSSRVQPAPLAALIVTNTTVFSNISDEYDKMIKIFPEMVANQTKEPGQTAFILCISDPVFVLTIDLKGSAVKLTTLDEPCKATATFRDAVEAALAKRADDSFDLNSDTKAETIPFAVTVNIPKKRAEFVLCSQGSDGCLAPVNFMKAPVEKLNVRKGITDFALVYSDNANTFKSSPKYICEISQTDIQMCWNPKTYAPVQCFKP